MIRVMFYKMNSTDFASFPIVEGQIIFVQDTKKLYIDKDNTHREQVEGLDLSAGTGIGINGMTITNAGVRSVEQGSTNGTISVDTNGTAAEVAVKGLGDLAFLNNISTSKITSGTLEVARGGTGASTLTSEQVLIGNGTSAVTTRAIDTTNGGTASSTSLITSGAVNAGLGTKLDTSLKGAVNGLAELDENGKVPSTQLPSYVDDVIEGYYYDSKFYKESTHITEISGETGKIYIDLDTEKTYRWSGSAFAIISETLALGTTSSTAYRGDYGDIAYSHATDANRLTTAQSEGLYKIATTAEGHIKTATAVTSTDLSNLGIAITDTKNTAGSTDTSSKIYLVGATSQAANPQTYSDNEVYTTNGVLTTKSIQIGGTATTIQYNSTDKCIEFNFS